MLVNTKIYIDFDGVILDTWSFIYAQYLNKYKSKSLEEIKIKRLMEYLGWEKIINNSNIINNSIKKIKILQSKYYVCILTKVNSEEEKLEKLKFLNQNGIFQIIFVPYEENKSRYVRTNGCYLIDDDLENLDDWHKNNGYSIYFNEYSNNEDSYGKINKNYKLIDNLDSIYDIIKAKDR